MNYDQFFMNLNMILTNTCFDINMKNNIFDFRIQYSIYKLNNNAWYFLFYQF